MRCRSLITILPLAVLLISVGVARASDAAIYPDWKGQWGRIGSGDWDPTKPRGLGQQAPLTPKYQAILAAGLADQARGGQGSNPGYQCAPHGMPRMMIGILPLEFIITPEATYIERPDSRPRRVFTDGRDWPRSVTPSFLGYSIGRWIDADGDGRYDTLLIETRGLTGTRSYDGSGIPLHEDGQSIIQERISLDQADPNRLYNEITTSDHALTRPWTVTRTYTRDPGREPVWAEYVCAESNHYVIIGRQDYVVNAADGNLMPVRKNEPPPDLKYFDQPRK
jgi:hypothetical protein